MKYQLYCYISDYTQDLKGINGILRDISQTAKKRNPTLAITGVLFFHQGRFLQIIEGPHNYIEYLMERIQLDPRHKNIKTILDKEVNKRGFPDWNMDVFHLSEEEQISEEMLAEAKKLFANIDNPDGSAFVDMIKRVLYFAEV